MKRFIFVVTFIFSLLSCNLTSTESDGIAAPNIISSNNTMIVTPVTVQNTSYMNIIRYQVQIDATTKKESIVDDSTFIIGQITPSSDYSGPTAFVDKNTSSSCYYQYLVRYKLSNGYSYSKTTGTYAGLCSSNGTGELSLSSSDYIDITFDSTNRTLEAPSDDIFIHFSENTSDDNLLTSYTTLDEDNTTVYTYTLMAALNNGTNTLLFPFSYSELSTTFTLDLQKSLYSHSDFYKTDLELSSIVAAVAETQYYSETSSESVEYYYYIYSEPYSKVTLKNTNGEEISSFNLSKDTTTENETIDITNYSSSSKSVKGQIKSSSSNKLKELDLTDSIY